MLKLLTRPVSLALCFTVDDVNAATRPIWTEPLLNHITKRFQRKVRVLPESEMLVTNSLWGELLSSDRKMSTEMLEQMQPRIVSRCHPLIEAVAQAFSQHRPLTLSPDAVWMTIEQGFAHHVAENVEALRGRLVRHQGKRELQAEVTGLDLDSFTEAIASFSSQIQNASNAVLYETLLCNFSTTTPFIRTASEVVLMDCYSSYFEYVMMCVCGIPRITVTGTITDWQMIRARIEVFASFELEWWITRLRPVLDEFILTVEGKPNLAFWQAIYKPRTFYVTTSVTGWISDLFPYLNDPPGRIRNPVFASPRDGWGTDQGIAEKSFPSGLASVPIVLKLRDGSVSEMDLVGGFFGVGQDDDLSLWPLISWAVTDRAPAKGVQLFA